MKKFLLLIHCSLSSVVLFSQEQITKYSRARIYYATAENFNALAQKGVLLDHGKHKVGVFIENDFSTKELNIAAQLGLEVEILIGDVQKYYKDLIHLEIIPVITPLILC